MVGVGVVEGGGHVLPEVIQGGPQLLLGRHHHKALGRQEIEQLAEAVNGQQLGDVGPIGLLLSRGHLRQLSVLGRKLGRRLYLDSFHLLEGTLREGGEEGQAFDLHVEELAAHRAFLGGRIYVEDVPAQGELPAILHLVTALVATRH